MLLSLLVFAVSSTWTATPSGDVWVYPNSSDPGGEVMLRAWGNGERAIDTAYPPGDEFSHGYLQFDLKDAPKGELEKATLTVWNIKNDELTEAVIKSGPLAVFPLKGTFSETKFAFGDKDLAPFGPPFGKSTSEKVEDGIKLTIDLLTEKGVFQGALDKARESGNLGLALATTLSPADSRSFIYKVHSKEGPKERRPLLTLVFKD